MIRREHLTFGEADGFGRPHLTEPKRLNRESASNSRAPRRAIGHVSALPIEHGLPRQLLLRVAKAVQHALG